MDETQPANEPMRRIRVGSVTAAIWANDGGLSVTISKSYKDDAGQWHNTGTLWHSDVLCAIKALERAEHVLHFQANPTR